MDALRRRREGRVRPGGALAAGGGGSLRRRRGRRPPLWQKRCFPFAFLPFSLSHVARALLRDARRSSGDERGAGSRAGRGAQGQGQRSDDVFLFFLFFSSPFFLLIFFWWRNDDDVFFLPFTSTSSSFFLLFSVSLGGRGRRAAPVSSLASSFLKRER